MKEVHTWIVDTLQTIHQRAAGQGCLFFMYLYTQVGMAQCRPGIQLQLNPVSCFPGAPDLMPGCLTWIKTASGRVACLDLRMDQCLFFTVEDKFGLFTPGWDAQPDGEFFIWRMPNLDDGFPEPWQLRYD